MSYQWHDIVGNIGVVLIILSYLLLQLNKLSAKGLNYSLLNLLGAILVLISLLYDFNLSSVIIEIFWIMISAIGIVNFLKKQSVK